MQLTPRILMLAVAVMALPVAAFAQEPPRYRISVVGEGSVSARPDLANIRAGVTTQGKTARAASDANSAAMAKVLEAVKTAGIAERDMQTAHFSIHPMYDSRRDGDNRITGFQASNQVTVKVRAVDKVATVLDRLIAAGANNVSGISFTVSEPSKLRDRARAEAVADAKRKAEVLAKAAGVRLGPAAVIVENGGSPVPMERMALRAAQAPSAPVAIGEQELRVHVNVTFELLK